jgi:Icc-related predicted phosphoesterase
VTTYPDLRELHLFRVLVTGDWHGHLKTAKAAIALAESCGADAIINVGDLMWRWSGDHPKTFDLPLEEELAKRDIFMVWADGNHDRHDLLRSMPVRDDGFVECSPRVFWAPRAHRWNWSGREFASMGGAFTVDYRGRREGWDVFKDVEEVQPEDVDKLGFGFVDVMFTHEVPADVPVRSDMELEAWTEQKANRSRHLLRRAVENTRPELVFSGHWHQRLTYDIDLREREGTSRVEVLDKDGKYGNAVILDLDDLAVTAPPLGWQDWTRKADRKRRSAEARGAYHLSLVEQTVRDAHQFKNLGAHTQERSD